MASREEVLRHATLHDERLLDVMLGTDVADLQSCLDGRTTALVQIGALVATGAPPAAFSRAATMALAAGASADQIVATLIAVAPIAGSPRVVDAAPKLAVGIGFDVEAELEDAPRLRVGSEVR